MANKILSIEDLKVNYGPIEAVRGISFDVFEGEVVSLIGANGAGKSSTLRAISGLVPSSGRVRFLGRDLTGMAPHKIVQEGLIQTPEGRGIFLNLTVTENLELGAYLRKDLSQVKLEMKQCFDLFPRLFERRHQSAGTLSGGEQQMLAISRSLLSKPRLLMLDEPSLGLAPKIVKQIFEIIRKLNQEEGLAILLVEQNAAMALRSSSRAYVLETGQITLSGPGAELLKSDRVREAYLGG
ncbi:ABC transporter ATP-binding protein [bacterium]|nr:ABC transporter ATP-binding protein [bacterium]